MTINCTAKFKNIFLLIGFYFMVVGNVTVKASETRLTQAVKPDFYSLELVPDLDKASFTGKETIKLKVAKETKDIVLNSSEIHIDQAIVTNEKTKHKHYLSVSYDNQNETATLTVTHYEKDSRGGNWEQTLVPGDYTLHLEYTGILNNKLRGFYLSKYKDSKNNEHKIATTQMEPADARRMFPCFDEPAFKAQYQITVKIDPNLTAISNAQISKKYFDAVSNKQVYEFAPTPKMSTYLVALIVGPFESTQSINKSGCEIRVWTVKGKTKLAYYARNKAGDLLPYYNHYFNIKYPINKLDLIAIPDFEAGAMENLGAITFREADLLIDENTGSVDNKQNIASIIAHEMAHMWFGDMVTMAWWDDLWLNEAFATWMSVKAVDYLEPSWLYHVRYTTWRLYAMNVDSLKCSRAIHANVSGPAEAMEMFDNITYLKGCSVLKMIESWVGEENFRGGVCDYLKAHLFDNATTSDLWQAIEAKSGKPVSQVAQNFVNQPGYPLLSLAIEPDNRLKVSQKQFFLNKDTCVDTIQNWLVPLNLACMEKDSKDPHNYQKNLDTIINDPNEAIQDFKCFEPYKANVNAHGYYRSRYPASNFDLLKNNNQKYLTAQERLTFLNDEWNLAKSCNIDFSDFDSLLNNFKHETDTYVLKEMIASLVKIANFIANDSLADFAKHSSDILHEALTKYGIDNKPGDSLLVRSLRSSLVTFLGTYGQNKEILANCKNYLDTKFYTQASDIDGDKLKTALNVVAFNGNKKDYDNIYNQYLKAQSPEIEMDCLYCLSNFQDPKLIARTLAMSLTDKVRIQDAPHLIGACFSNRNGQGLALTFFENNYDIIASKFAPMSIPHLIHAMSNLSNESDLTKVKTFFETHPLKLGKQSLKETLEIIDSNVKFKQANWMSK